MSIRIEYPALQSSRRTWEPTNPLAPVRKTRSVGKRRANALLERAGRLQDSRRFVSAMRHAVGTFRILTASVERPIRFLNQFFVALRVGRVGHQVARPLPAQNRIRRNSPRRAFHVEFAFEEIQIERTVIEPPFLAPSTGKRFAEDRARAVDAQEMLLIGRLLIRISRRNLHRIDAQLVVEVIEDAANRSRIVRIEERRVRSDAKTFILS